MSIAGIRAQIRELFGIVPTLDLHGLGVKQALKETESFLREAQACGWGSVRIVYGKGRHSRGGQGVLRGVVPHWLDGDGRAFVRRYERHLDASGDDGAVFVWVRDAEEFATPESD